MNIYEHAKTKQVYEVPVGELSPEFFLAVQEQLSVLVGSPDHNVKVAAEGMETDSTVEPVSI